jgi:hypothetical protein
MSPGIGKRRHKRIAAVVPVRLWGMDSRGRPFIEVSKTANVSRCGALLREVPAKLAPGDIIGLRNNDHKHRFRVVWLGSQGTPEADSVGLQSLEPDQWIWDQLRLPAEDVDIYARPQALERRLLNRTRCLLSAEVAHGGAGQLLTFITELSLGGCYIAMNSPLSLEEHVTLGIWVDGQTKLWVEGIVVSSHPYTGMGVKFLGLSRTNCRALENCLKQLSQSAMSGLSTWFNSK